MPVKVAGAIAGRGQDLREVLFALLDAAGGRVDVTAASIRRVGTEPLVIRRTPTDGGGYVLELVDNTETEPARLRAAAAEAGA